MIDLDALDHMVDADLAAADRSVAEVQRGAERRLATEAEQWREFATRPEAPAQWRRVVERVESGELRWYDLADGRLWQDEDVAAAIAASHRQRQPTPDPPDDDDDMTGSPLRRD